VALNSTQFNIARGVGPLVGGLMIAGGGVGWALALNPISFLAVLSALLTIEDPPRMRPPPSDLSGPAGVEAKRPPAASAGLIEGFGDAWRHGRSRPGIFSCMVTVTLVSVLGSPLFSFLAKFNDDIYELGDTGYALLAAAQGLGGIAAAPFLPRVASVIPRSRIILISTLLYGTCVTFTAVAPNEWFAGAALCLAGAAYLATAATNNTTIQIQVDDAYRGRVLAIYVMGLTAGLPLGAQIQGLLAERFGLTPVVAIAGLMLVMVTLARWAAGHFTNLDDERTQPT